MPAILRTRVGLIWHALRTRAERDGDEWVINGQGAPGMTAHFSDYGVIVVRTDPTVPKHKGLSYFYVDMKAPGVEIKPIKQLTGDSDFNEVHFNDVRVSDQQRLGEVGQGWQVSLTTLMNERAAIGGGFGQMDVALAMAVAQKVEIDGRPALKTPASGHGWPLVRRAWPEVHRVSIAHSAVARRFTRPENSIGKLVGAPKMQAMSSYLMDLLAVAVRLQMSLGDRGGHYSARLHGGPGLHRRGHRRNHGQYQAAERVLGLPQSLDSTRESL